MGARVSVRNDTPHYWYFASRGKEMTLLAPGGSASYEEQKAVHCYIHFRNKKSSLDNFVFEFNTHKGDTTFILRETPDRSQIQLYCTSEGLSQYCQNQFGF